jgi:uncharacterized tellurite resistance protein B-like protein
MAGRPLELDCVRRRVVFSGDIYMGDNNKLIGGRIDVMFEKSKSASAPAPFFTQEKKKERARVERRDLELAVTVLLVDLAAADQNFQPREYQLMANALKSIFGTPRHEVQNMVNQANTILRNLRGTSYYAKMLKENLDDKAKKALMEIIDEIIMADGTEDGMEIYLRQKMAMSLGVELVTAPSE